MSHGWAARGALAQTRHLQAGKERRSGLSLCLATRIGSTIAIAVVGFGTAEARCVVAPIGQVTCGGETKTRPTENLDGTDSVSTDRTQDFTNGVAIVAKIGRHAVVKGSGLRLTNANSKVPAPISLHNNGRVFTRKALIAVRLDGRGAALTYDGRGRIDDIKPGSTALYVKNRGGGDVSISTGRGAITGDRGIEAHAGNGGAVTIATGSGRITGTNSQGILARTGSGPLDITIGSGGVTGRGKKAILARSTNGDVTVIADGRVLGTGRPADAPPALKAVSFGAGNIVIGGSGTVTSRVGRGIWAQQDVTGTGSVLVTGTGDVNGLGALCPGGHPRLARRNGKTGCSGIRAVIKNPASAGNVTVDRSGNVTATSAAINAFTRGSGNVTVTTGRNAQLKSLEFGIETKASGPGNISISTSGARSSIRTGGTGIIAENAATAIPVAAVSAIRIDTQGSIVSRGNSFDSRNSTDFHRTLDAIAAGYLGGATSTSNQMVNGTVDIANSARLRARAGTGILAFDYGKGAIDVTNNGAIAARTGIALIGGPGVSQTIANDADIRGRVAAIDLRAANTTMIAQQGGRLTGDVLLSGKGDTLDVSGGAIAGDILGNSATNGANAGTVDFDAARFKTGGSIDVADINVNSGTLTLADDLTVFDAVTNNATVRLNAIGARTINGDYVQTANGRLAVSVGPNGSGRLAVTKDAALAGTLEIDVRPNASGFATAKRYTLVEAGGMLSGTFASVATRSDLPFVSPTIGYSAQRVILRFGQTSSAFASVAASPNQVATARAFEALPAASQLYRAIVGQNVAGARQAFDAASGEVHASTVTAGFEDSRLVRESILNRLQTAGDGSTVWSRAFGDFGRNGGNGNASSLERSVGGFVIGTDAPLSGAFSPWRVGIAGAYTRDDLTVADLASSAGLETFEGSIYAGARYGAIDIRLGAVAGGTSADIKRSVGFPGFSEAERSNDIGLVAQGLGELGYRYALGRAVVEPMVTGAIIHIRQGSFQEDGGVAAVSGAGRDNDLGTTTIGLRGETTLFAALPLTVHGFLGWEHAFGDVDPGALVAFAAGSSSFTVAGAPIDRDALSAQADVDWRAASDLTLGVAYSGQIGRRAQDSAIRGRLEYDF